MEPKSKIQEFPISLSSDGVDEHIPFHCPTNKESLRCAIQLLKDGPPFMVVGI